MTTASVYSMNTAILTEAIWCRKCAAELKKLAEWLDSKKALAHRLRFKRNARPGIFFQDVSIDLGGTSGYGALAAGDDQRRAYRQDLAARRPRQQY